MTRWNQAEQTQYGSAEEYFSIIRRTVLKRWWLIVLFAAAASIAGLAGSMLVEPVYQASSTIRIQQNLLGAVSWRASSVAQRGVLDTEAIWIKNRSLLEEVMDKTGAAATARSQKERIARMEKLRDSITITMLSDSLQVTVEWNDAQLVAKIANTLADSFIERYGALNREEARELRLLLEQQSKLVHLKLDEAQRKLAEFVRRHGNIMVSQQGLASSERIAEVRTKLAQDNIALADASKRLEFIKKRLGEDAEALSELELGVVAEQLASNPSIQTLKTQISQLQERVAALNSLYTEEYPELRTMKARLVHSQQALVAELAKIIPEGSISIDDPGKVEFLAEFIRIRSEVERLTNRQSELTVLVSNLEEEARELPDKEAQYFSLLRNQTINADLYNTLLTRLTEAKLAEETDTWNVRVIERAYVPYLRLRPKPVKNAAFGVFIGVLLGLAVCMLLEYLDDSFKMADEVEGCLQLPVLAVLPRFDRLPELEYGPKKRH